MSRLSTRLAIAASSAALVLGSFIGPALAVDIEVSGNGVQSNNTVNFSQNNTTNVTQNNTANVSNNVNVSQDTGNNEANKNTGGNVSIDTGKASSNVTVNNTVNSNEADVNPCCPGNVTVKVSGNGVKSDNDVTVNAGNNVTVNQDNYAYIKNKVKVDQDTGNNEANKNTGGDVSVTTGDAKSGVWVSNAANANSAEVSSANGGGTFSVTVTGNGVNSDNDVLLKLGNKVKIDQDNNAKISNDVYVEQDTGNNDAKDNTGGEVSITTGDATSNVNVSNEANANLAEVDPCGCILDGSIKVAGNGVDSNNDVTLSLGGPTDVNQDNNFSCGKGKDNRGEWTQDGDGKKNCNDVYVDQDTGNNDANKNTLFNGEPSITTGDASSDVKVDNTANSNTVGNVDVEGDHVTVHANLEGLLALLLGLLS